MADLLLSQMQCEVGRTGFETIGGRSAVSDVSNVTRSNMTDDENEEKAEQIETELDADRMHTTMIYYSYATIIVPIIVAGALFAFDLPLAAGVVLFGGVLWVLTAIKNQKSK